VIPEDGQNQEEPLGELRFVAETGKNGRADTEFVQISFSANIHETGVYGGECKRYRSRIGVS
jgi:hypothetical protein